MATDAAGAAFYARASPSSPRNDEVQPEAQRRHPADIGDLHLRSRCWPAQRLVRCRSSRQDQQEIPINLSIWPIGRRHLHNDVNRNPVAKRRRENGDPMSNTTTVETFLTRFTSGDTSGDYSSVVGYAGICIHR